MLVRRPRARRASRRWPSGCASSPTACSTTPNAQDRATASSATAPREVVAVVDARHAGARRERRRAVRARGRCRSWRPWPRPAALGADRLVIGVAPIGGKLTAGVARRAARGDRRRHGRRGRPAHGARRRPRAGGGGPRARASSCATCAPAPTDLDVPRGPYERARRCASSHTVGSDCAIGKMTVDAGARPGGARRAASGRVFVATGQTGIAISGWGIAVDHVISDYIAGAAERLVDQGAERGDLLFVEGQGSLLPPGLLRRHARPAARLGARRAGALPPGRARPRSTTTTTVPIPPLSEVVALYEARVRRRCARRRVAAIALNTREIADDAAARRGDRAAAAETGLRRRRPRALRRRAAARRRAAPRFRRDRARPPDGPRRGRGGGAAAASSPRAACRCVPWLVPGGRATTIRCSRQRVRLPTARRPCRAGRRRIVGRDGPDVRVQRQALIVVRRMLDLQAGRSCWPRRPTSRCRCSTRSRPRRRRAAASSACASASTAERALLEHSTPEALAAPDAIGRAALAAADAQFRSQGEHRADALEGIDASRVAARVQAQAVVRKLRFARAADGSLRWAVTAFPCAPYAARSGLDEAAFADLVYAAAGLRPSTTRSRSGSGRRGRAGGAARAAGGGARAAHRRAGHRRRAAASTGARGARRPPTATCRTARSSPARIEDSAEGVVTFAAARRTTRAGASAGVRLALRAGEVVEAHRRRGRGRARRGARHRRRRARLGEVGIGTNYALTAVHRAASCSTRRSAAPFHLALGAGYPGDRLAPTSRRCTGTWSATCAAAASCCSTAGRSSATAASCRPQRAATVATASSCSAATGFALGGRTLVMGIVNNTPDSFYDGGRHCGAEAAAAHGRGAAGRRRRRAGRRRPDGSGRRRDRGRGRDRRASSR